VLALPAARASALVASAVVALALAAGAVRVLPTILAPSVPASLAGPLLRAALGVALETGLFVAPPLAWALAAARAVDRGEARALEALGVRPARLVASSWPALAAVLVAAALAAAAWGREAAAPGRLARDLVASARAACERGPAPRAVDVPLVGLSWVCLPGAPPRVVGPAPLGGGRAALAASSVELSDDLRALVAEDLALALDAPGPADDPPAAARIHVGHAVVRGLQPLGKASNLGAFARTALLGATSALVAAAVALAVLAVRVARRATALLVGLAGASAALLVFSSLERAPASPLLYLAVPAAGVLAPLALGLVVGADLGRAALRRAIGARRRAREQAGPRR
jgi:hypothetical protein